MNIRNKLLKNYYHFIKIGIQYKKDISLIIIIKLLIHLKIKI